jgi:hypothetical protein
MLRHHHGRITPTRRSGHNRLTNHIRHTDQTAKVERNCISALGPSIEAAITPLSASCNASLRVNMCAPETSNWISFASEPSFLLSLNPPTKELL